MSWWLILHTPDGPHVWDLGDPDDTTRGELVERARTLIGFPVAESWLSDYEHWHPMLSYGDPHPTLLAKATVHDVADLAKVPAVQLDDYRRRCHESVRQAQLDAARAALANLDPAQLDALKAELGGTAATTRTPGVR